MTTSRTKLTAYVPMPALIPAARSVECDDEHLRVTLADGRIVLAPLMWFPLLANATPDQRRNWQLMGKGEGIHWSDIDEDISVASLLGLPAD